MSIFHQLKQALLQQLQTNTFNENIVELNVEIPLPDEYPHWLAWLKGQNHFPQFFWQSRDEDYTLVALGAAQSFYSLDEAQAFSERYPYALVGGLTFERECYFILPRLRFAKNHHKLTACCYVSKQDAPDVEQFLTQLSPPVTLENHEYHLLKRHLQTDFPHWESDIKQAIDQIKQSELRKVVLANATTLYFDQAVCPYRLLFDSQQQNLGCYHFLWSQAQGEAFMGSSPERLYLRQGRKFYTEALAGTAPVTTDETQTQQSALWLLNDAKNRYENWLVVDDICSHLTGCTDDIHVGEVQIKRLQNVQHLRRIMQTQLADHIKDSDCLARIHPTAAVAGLPRQLATEFIHQHENFERGWYAGTFGYFTPENAEFCVALRSGLICENRITLYAGAGIVEGSSAKAEWQEIERKSLAMANLLGSAR